jgi:UDP-4-amino-4,6-dideoxy-N-acetyl-beta-L-altrosamine N-acetyltransferase
MSPPHPYQSVLRDIQENELNLMLSWRNNEMVRSNMYTRHIISLDEHMAWWERTQKRVDQRYFMFEQNGKPAGIVGFMGIDPANHNSFWAFYASPDAPAGTGSRMEFLALEHAFETMQLHKLHCEVLAFNQKVIKLHQKFGFKTEGIFRAHHFINGSYVDVYRLGIMSSEWKEIRPLIHKKIYRESSLT